MKGIFNRKEVEGNVSIFVYFQRVWYINKNRQKALSVAQEALIHRLLLNGCEYMEVIYLNCT